LLIKFCHTTIQLVVCWQFFQLRREVVVGFLFLKVLRHL
jgi:hypothetical protein